LNLLQQEFERIFLSGKRDMQFSYSQELRFDFSPLFLFLVFDSTIK
jgi:hypothetical protein